MKLPDYVKRSAYALAAATALSGCSADTLAHARKGEEMSIEGRVIGSVRRIDPRGYQMRDVYIQSKAHPDSVYHVSEHEVNSGHSKFLLQELKDGTRVRLGGKRNGPCDENNVLSKRLARTFEDMSATVTDVGTDRGDLVELD